MSKPTLRIRYSLEYLQNLYDTGKDRSPLENLIRAFRGIQKLEPKNPNSFFCIAGYHGEPFRGNGQTDPSWWGGYCWHGTVLFPTWHRAYLLRLEDALRSIDGCKDVTLPYWDELINREATPPKPIPTILTSPKFQLDGEEIDNPLYSYKLQKALTEKVTDANNRYTKHKGYETVRYPFSGLVGTESDRAFTESHNAEYQKKGNSTDLLNANVASWIEGTVRIPADNKDPNEATRQPDTFSVYSQYLFSLQAPNYTVFSNSSSQNRWRKEHSGTDQVVFSLENAHNSIHLAVGGFYQKGHKDGLNADPIIGANGDMGDNETAGFDPIFYFHHCFCDYVFAMWQKEKGFTKRGSLTLLQDPEYDGTVLLEGQPGFDPNTVLDMKTPLIPFEKPGEKKPGEKPVYYSSDDVTDIVNDLHYDYATGSVHPELRSDIDIDLGSKASIVLTKRIHGVNRTQYEGSFIIRLYAQGHDGKEVEVGREPVLSRWSLQGCANCQSHLEVESFVFIDEILLKALQGPGKKEDIKWWAEVHTRDRLRRPPVSIPEGGGQGEPEAPKVEDHHVLGTSLV